MSTYLGKEGAVKIGAATVGEVRSFKIDLSANTVDVSRLGDDWTRHRPTQNSWTAEIDMWSDEDDAGQTLVVVGAELAVELYPEAETTGRQFHSGTGIIASISNSQAHDGVIERSITLTGIGELVKAAVP